MHGLAVLRDEMLVKHNDSGEIRVVLGEFAVQAGVETRIPIGVERQH
jgi:hypothetical protein